MANLNWLNQLSAFSVCAALSMSAYAQQTHGICPALKHIVGAGDTASLRDDPAARPILAQGPVECHIAGNTYDCHWQAVSASSDGTAAAALQELGADIAACLPDAVHDVNSPSRQHFYIESDTARVNVTATTQGNSQLRLVVSH